MCQKKKRLMSKDKMERIMYGKKFDFNKDIYKPCKTATLHMVSQLQKWIFKINLKWKNVYGESFPWKLTVTSSDHTCKYPTRTKIQREWISSEKWMQARFIFKFIWPLILVEKSI